MSTWIMIVQFFLSLSLLIILHEGGHFFAAKWFGTRVEKFYLFFDPYFSLFKKKFGDTEYGIGWLPLGGYVKISGMIDESMDKEQMKGPAQPWEFRSKTTWQRLIIMLGGVVVNFLLGFFIFAMMSWQWGEAYLPTSEVTQGIYVDSVGYEMGLRNGDKILSIGDKEFDQFDDHAIVREVVLNSADNMKVQRNGQTMTLPIPDKFVSAFASRDFKGKTLFQAPYPFVISKPGPGSPSEKAGILTDDQIIQIGDVKTEYAQDFFNNIIKFKGQTTPFKIKRGDEIVNVNVNVTEFGKIGAEVKTMNQFYNVKYNKYGFFESFPIGVKRGIKVITDQFSAFGQMFAGKINVRESLGGPIAIANMFPKFWDARRFWTMTAVLSMILGFMNLLPIPALDGGHVMFLLWEMATGKKPSDKFMEVVTLIGFGILMTFMIFVFGNDIYNSFFR